MPNWSDLSVPANNIVTRTEWLKVINNARVMNDFIGSTDGGHASFGTDLIMLGGGQGNWSALATVIWSDGKMIVGDGVTAPQGLTIGADNTVLRGDSSQAVGVTWDLPNWEVAEALAYG